jgi:predicted acetyltransferase
MTDPFYTHTHSHTHVFREHFFVVAQHKNECHSFGKEACREIGLDRRRTWEYIPFRELLLCTSSKEGVQTTMELGGVRSVFERRINAACFTL